MMDRYGNDIAKSLKEIAMELKESNKLTKELIKIEKIRLDNERLVKYIDNDQKAVKEVLADITGMSVDDTMDALTKKLIFDNNRKLQKEDDGK